MGTTNRSISFVIGFMILGLLLSTSFYSQQRVMKPEVESRKEDLMNSVKDLESEREHLKDKLSKLRAEVENYEKQAAANEGVLVSFTQESEELKEAAGLTSLKGSGVEVVLADSTQFPELENPNNYIIHDYDLHVAVNALINGGAKGIDINGQRLVSTSAIRCAGNTIMVNSTRLTSPYKIRAIGNPDRLFNTLREDEGFSQLSGGLAKAFGLVVQVNKLSELTLASYKGRIQLEYARAVKEQR